VDYFDLTLQTLAVRMVQIESKGIFGSDLAGPVNEDVVERGKGAEVSGTGGIRIVSVFISDAGSLLSMPLTGLLLKGLV